MNDDRPTDAYHHKCATNKTKQNKTNERRHKFRAKAEHITHNTRTNEKPAETNRGDKERK